MAQKKTEHPLQLNFLDLLKVQQTAFEGPLALLLELIRKHRVEIHQINLAEICTPYLEYLEMMERFDLEVAVDFLEIASTLVWIKSKSLLPALEEPIEEEGPDPEEELKRRLEAYQTYRRLARALDSLPLLGRDQFVRPFELELEESEVTEEFVDLSVYRLLEAFKGTLTKKGYQKAHHVDPELKSLEQRITELFTRLQPEQHHRFTSLLEAGAGKPEVVLSFMAILELAKYGGLNLTQADQYSELHLYVTPHFAVVRKNYLETRASG
ncbi:MAG: ScpA family protein [bacterium]|nr:ScpA family protein [bacterium]